MNSEHCESLQKSHIKSIDLSCIPSTILEPNNNSNLPTFIQKSQSSTEKRNSKLCPRCTKNNQSTMIWFPPSITAVHIVHKVLKLIFLRCEAEMFTDTNSSLQPK